MITSIEAICDKYVSESNIDITLSEPKLPFFVTRDGSEIKHFEEIEKQDELEIVFKSITNLNDKQKTLLELENITRRKDFVCWFCDFPFSKVK